MEEVMCIHQYFNDKTGCDGCAMGMIASCQTCQKLPGTCYKPVKTEDEERQREQEENFMMIYHDIERPGAAELIRPLYKKPQNCLVRTNFGLRTLFFTM